MKRLSNAVLAVAVFAVLPQVHAQQPTNLTIVIPFTPGGAADNLARVLSQGLASQPGYETVIVENKPGASGQVAMNAIKAAKPDGNTVFLAHAGAFTLNRFVYKNLNYDADQDLVPVAIVATAPVFLLAPAEKGASSVEQLIEAGKIRPLNYGSPGVGTETHLAGEVFGASAGIDVEHAAYKGAGPALIDLASGRLDFMFDVLIGSNAFLKDGRLKVLAAASDKRSQFLPDIPTLKELGIDKVDFSLWWGVAAPAGTPDEVVQRLSRDIAQALDQPKIIKDFAELGVAIGTTTPEQMKARMAEDVQRLKATLDEINLDLES